jgi:hypothetical protein
LKPSSLPVPPRRGIRVDVRFQGGATLALGYSIGRTPGFAGVAAEV